MLNAEDCTGLVRHEPKTVYGEDISYMFRSQNKHLVETCMDDFLCHLSSCCHHACHFCLRFLLSLLFCVCNRWQVGRERCLFCYRVWVWWKFIRQRWGCWLCIIRRQLISLYVLCVSSPKKPICNMTLGHLCGCTAIVCPSVVYYALAAIPPNALPPLR